MTPKYSFRRCLIFGQSSKLKLRQTEIEVQGIFLEL